MASTSTLPSSGSLDLSEDQDYAVSECANVHQRIVSVTGAAGTGKTTILRYAYGRLRDQSRSVILCAPTGRAARRISEATGYPATTIHKLLAFPRPLELSTYKDNPDDPSLLPTIEPDRTVRIPGKPRFNRNNPLPFSAVLVDEASMIGPSLMADLMDALNPRSVVRFYGDTNQLPPVEEGQSPFRLLLRNEPSITLSHNYRSDDEIVGNASRILKSRMPQPNERFHIIYTDDPYGAVLEHASERHQVYTSMNGQVLTPQRRRGALTTSRLNPALQILFNRSTKSLMLDRLDKKDPPLLVRRKDKFLWIQNDYEMEIFNGEIGTIADLNPELGDLTLDLYDRLGVVIEPSIRTTGPYGAYHYDPRKQIELGYAVTTHKAQGSEFDEVIYAMSGKQPYLLNRNNLYTAITRAKHRITLICDRKAMGLSMHKVV